MAVNVHALDAILGLVKESVASYFHYFQYRYAVGDVVGAVPELPVSAGRFHNVYEESKALAKAGCQDLPAFRYCLIPSSGRPSFTAICSAAPEFKALYAPLQTAVAVDQGYLPERSAEERR